MLTHYVIALLVTGLTHFVLALFVYSKGTDRRINICYGLYSLAIAWWSTFEALSITIVDPNVALFWWRVNHVGVIFIPVFFTYFVVSLLEPEKARSKEKLLKLVNILTVCFFILNMTPLFIHSVEPKFAFKNFINPGPFYFAFFAFWIILAHHGLFVLFKLYYRSSGGKRTQLTYFFWSMLIAYLFGIPNFFPTFNIELYPINPFGTYAISIYAFVTVYAIVRFRLMAIDTIVRRALVFAGIYAPIFSLLFVITYYGFEGLYEIFGLSNIKTNKTIFIIAAAGFIALSIKPLDKFLVRVTDKFLYQKKYDYQKLLKDAARGMALVTDLERLLSLIVHFMTSRMRLKKASVFLLDDSEKRYILRAHRGAATSVLAVSINDPLLEYLQGLKMPLIREELVNLAKSERELKKIELTPEKAKKIIARLKKLGTEVIVPSISQRGMLGFITLGEKRSRDIFTQSDIDTLAVLSHDAAIAITNAKTFENLKHAQQQIAQQEKLAAVGKLAADVSHEIRNPLTVVMGRAEYFLQQNPHLDLKTKNIFMLIVKHTKRQLQIVERLLKFSRKKEFHMIPLAIEIPIKEAVDMLEQQATLNDTKVTTSFAKTLPLILGDTNLLHEVFFNLINNAEQAINKKGGRIHIDTMSYEDTIQVTITDTGPGISPEQLSKIFDPFFTTKEKGTGLGLALCNDFIARHKGTMTVASIVGQGTTFTVKLPIIKNLDGKIQGVSTK